VDYAKPAKIYEALPTDHADLELVSYPEARKELKLIPWRREEMTVVALLHPLARKKVVTAADLTARITSAFLPDPRWQLRKMEANAEGHCRDRSPRRPRLQTARHR
jgi:hypothetical protein